METALRITELWRERIFNSLEEAVLVVTPDRKLVNVNDGAVKMFGYSREELASLSTAVMHVDQDHYVEFGRRGIAHTIRKVLDDPASVRQRS